MAYGVKYNMPIRNGFTGDAYLLEIQEKDYSGPAGTLKGTDEPVVIKYIDNDENKYPAISASEMTISFISEVFDVTSIISNEDDKYRVELKRILPTGTQLNWRGVLSVDDISEPYISGAREFTLKAIDGLGLLKNVSNSFSYGKITLLEAIKICLIPTFTDLDISINCGLFEESMSDFVFSNPFDQCKIHTKFFTNSDSGPKNMYDSLIAIMTAFQCTIFQQNAQWHIKRKPDERLGASPANSTYNFNTLDQSTESFDWLVERHIDFVPVNARHKIRYQRSSSSSVYQHDYVVPEVPANPDLTEGGRFPLLDVPPLVRAYTINFWTSLYGPQDSPSAAGMAWRREFDNIDTGITESYVVIRDFIAGQEQRLISTDDPYFDAGDRIEFSLETRAYYGFFDDPTDVGIARIRLFGDSGQQYVLNFDTKDWEPVAANVHGDYALFINGIELANEWRSVSVESDGIPEGGRIVWQLKHWAIDVPSGIIPEPNETWYRDIRITPKLFLNNVTFELKGEKSTTTDGTTSSRLNKVNTTMGQCPKRIIAGALYKLDDDTQLLTVNWHTYEAPGVTKRLLDINSVDLQYGSYRVMAGLDGDFYGIKWTRKNGSLIGPGNKFNIDGVIYIATNIEMDIANGIWTGRLVEISSTETVPELTTTFKYIFGNERS